MPLGDLLRLSAARHPEKTALICESASISYAGLDRAVDGLARWLLAQGLEPGDRVALHSDNSIEVVSLFFACFRAGLIAVPVNWRMKAPEVGYVLEHSGARLCYTTPALEAIARDAQPACPLVTSLPDVSGGAGDFTAPADDGTAMLLYTSGTTARPRGVAHTHRSLFDTAGLMSHLGLDGGQIVLQSTSVMHASGINCAVIPSMIFGATMVLLPMFRPDAALDAIERHGCTFGALLPTMLQFIVEEQAARPRNVGSAKLFYGGGDAVPAAVRDRFENLFGIPLLEVFGMTETVPTCCNVYGATRPGSVGRLMPGVEARVLDLTGQDLPDGEIGEMAVRSPANFAGYWNDPRETAATLVDGWLLTGDLVRRDADGYYWFEGRKKQIIVRGGSNVAPQEVEDVLYRHPAVLEAGVIGMPDAMYGERVIAYVSLRGAVTEDELREFARARLADYKAPERVVFLPELPKGITGKVQRRALKEMAAGAG